MKVRVNFSLSQTGQKAQAVAGLPAQQDQSIEMDLSHPTVLEAVEINALGGCRLDLYHEVTAKHQTYPPFYLLTERKYWTKVPSEAEIAQFLDQQTQLRAAAEADLPQLQAEYDARLAAEREEQAKTKAEDEARRAARLAAEAEAKEAAENGKEALRAWAAAYGSDLLCARLAGGFAWQSLAREELVATRMLEGYVVWDETPWATGKSQDWKSPGLEEICELQKLTGLEPPYSNPRLLWICDINEGDDDATQEKYGVIAVDLICPDGHTVTLAKWRILA